MASGRRRGIAGITALEGWMKVGQVADRAERIWRREGLKVPQKVEAAWRLVERWLVRTAAAGAAEPQSGSL